MPALARLLTVALLVIGQGAYGDGTAPIIAESGHTYTVPVRTIKEMKLMRAFRTTVRQQYDFSCGSAALATLLTYHYGQPVTEAAVFEAMYATGDRAKIRREGFSLLDMKRFMDAHGYRADGVKISLDTLAEAGVPAIALVSDQGYRHFVVVKGQKGDLVVLGDPALGTRIVPRKQFESSRVGGIFFVVRGHRDAVAFNEAVDWNARLTAPLALAVGRDSLATTMLSIPTADRF